jgi:hypothetical protein
MVIILTEQQLLNAIKEKTHFDRIVNSLGRSMEPEILDKVKTFVKDYVSQKGYNLKFLNSCSTGFAGVRTKNQIIICAPNFMTTLGDFIYTIFHEIRHEEQMTSLKMSNPLHDMDLDDFEKLSDRYWQLELDADNFAKRKVAELMYELNIPVEKSKPQFILSQYIQNYQFASNFVKNTLRSIVNMIKDTKKQGVQVNDIQDLPMVKQYLEKLETFI